MESAFTFNPGLTQNINIWQLAAEKTTNKITLEMDESQYINKRAITSKQITYLIDSNFI